MLRCAESFFGHWRKLAAGRLWVTTAWPAEAAPMAGTTYATCESSEAIEFYQRAVDEPGRPCRLLSRRISSVKSSPGKSLSADWNSRDMNIRAIFSTYTELCWKSDRLHRMRKSDGAVVAGILQAGARFSRLEFSIACNHCVGRQHEIARRSGILTPEMRWPAIVAEVVPEVAGLSEARRMSLSSAKYRRATQLPLPSKLQIHCESSNENAACLGSRPMPRLIRCMNWARV